ncbi:unnamed protein product [Umbelopsis vinacea]
MHYGGQIYLEDELNGGYGKVESVPDSQLAWIRQSDAMETFFTPFDGCYQNTSAIWPTTVDAVFDPTFSWPSSEFIHDVGVISPACLVQNSACASPVSGGLPSLCDTETASPEYHSGNVTPILMDADTSHLSESPLAWQQLKLEQSNLSIKPHSPHSSSETEYLTQKDICLWQTDIAHHPYDQPIRLPIQTDLEKISVLPNTPKSVSTVNEDSVYGSPEHHRHLESKPASPALSLKRSYSQSESAVGDDFGSDYKQDETEVEEEEEEEEEEDDDDEDDDVKDDDDDDGSDEYDDTMPLKRKPSRVQAQFGKKTRKNYSKDITRVLMNWYLTNNGLLPDQETKSRLAGLTNKTPIQISTWYQNARRRHHLKLKRFQGLHAQNPGLVFDYESLMSYVKEQKAKHVKRPQESKRSKRRCK